MREGAPAQIALATKEEDIDLSAWEVDVFKFNAEEAALKASFMENELTEESDDRTYQKPDFTEELKEMNSKFENV